MPGTTGALLRHSYCAPTCRFRAFSLRRLRLAPSASTAGADIHTCYHWTAVELISAAYARDERFALFVETLAITGARPSQVSRIEVGDLRAADLAEAKLMMPRSGRRRTASRPKESRAHQRADHRSLGGAAEGGGGRPAL
jgi:hypothetical protein